jgi:hypothetical protein
LDPDPSLIFAYTIDTNLVWFYRNSHIACSTLVSGAEVALFSLSQTELMKRQGNPSKEKLYPSYWKRPKNYGDTSGGQ